MKQLALAVHNYHDQHKTLPRNGYNKPTPGLASPLHAPNWSWIARILPQIEQDAVQALAAWGKSSIEQAPLIDAATGTPNPVIFNPTTGEGVAFPILFCPSDRASSVMAYANRGGWPDPALSVPVTNYRGVSGQNWELGVWGTPPNGPIFGKNLKGLKSSEGVSDGDGMFFHMDALKGRLKVTDIADGSSNTFTIGEDIPEMNIYSSWPYSGNANGTCAIPPNVGVLRTYECQTNGTFCPPDVNNVYSFRSRHSGGLHFAYADGSVRFVPDGISIGTYRALASIRNGEVLPSDAP
jgi:prepilin-type processing-associated H-X9-DG protein